MPSDHDVTARIYGLLRLRHETGRGEWATFGEFSPGTGASPTSGRRWDFLAVSCWGAAKGHRVCYEIKASRGDWLKELSDPGKRAFAERLCHETWIATIPGVVRDGEAPEGWGVLEATGSVLRSVRAATQRATVETPDAFVAALARRGMEDGETQPPPAPRGAWRFNGKDIPEADLVKTCREILDKDHDIMVKRGIEDGTRALAERVRRLEGIEREILTAYNQGREHPVDRLPTWGIEGWVAARLTGQTVDTNAIADEIGALAERVRRGEIKGGRR